MKFGKTFESLLTSEWRQQYVNYEGMKIMIRSAVDKAPGPSEASSTEVNAYFKGFENRFLETCQEELTRVNNFFAHKQAEAQRKLATLKYQVSLSARAHGHQEPSGSKIRMQDEQLHPPHRRKLRLAMSEFYLSLIMLQNYQMLNHTAFRKICKKYDKYLKSHAALHWYERFVLKASFVKSSELLYMIMSVEDLYTEYLANGDRSKAMARLRVPPLGQPTPPIHVFCASFLLGLFIVGAVICLISYFALSLTEEYRFMFVTLFRGPVASATFAFVLALNLNIWQRVGINHVLIFEVERRNSLGSVMALEIAGVMGYLCTLSVLLYLFHGEFYVKHPYVIPLVPVVIFVVLLLNPIPILYSSARFWLLRTMGRVILTPVYHVRFVEFWMADQWNSLVICFVDHYYLIRFYVRYFTGRTDAYDFEPDFMVAVIRCLPSWFRFAQCLRRFRDSRCKTMEYLMNATKYVLNMVVVICSTVQMETNANYGFMFENPWTWAYLIFAIVSTLYSLGWDLLMDFGLFKIWKGENIFLRENLVYSKAFYYFAIIENVLLRCAWIVEIVVVYYGLMAAYNAKTVILFCEIFRRFVWNLLRLENEHLNNCGKFRATRDIFMTKLYPQEEHQLEKIMDDSDNGGEIRFKKFV